ncbi:hypothetical protein [Pseudomonas fluorescens]|uniref:Uncharacterized protein n=1 Tax=Pseudomonas fluorescens TaxID=294 RepID=A0ABY1TJS6_PSEFL|nr:hypothetical protein [Pseudomonas fluorescens]MCI4607266.1 hypothetical protein [Pseudomonas fluorescens]PQA99931.1 hypothetical protein B0A76_16430 [Pseudomonas fluorescens]RFP96130.1 hypothetical protein D0N73_11020 [Pseudomonas fluorescens]TWR44733.1 hypothetical protein FIP59_24035 [Pseudomonas fluorescens]UKJ66724.1 hypothetical protein H1Q68_17440 [Pseudomonas fluorescens]
MAPITRQRTKAYFDWAAARVPYSSKEETLPNGVFIEACGRQLSSGQIQLFVGVHTAEGKPVLEDYTDNAQGMTVQEAIDWGFDRGRSVANGQK